jgi:hypothetical protein
MNGAPTRLGAMNRAPTLPHVRAVAHYRWISIPTMPTTRPMAITTRLP